MIKIRDVVWGLSLGIVAVLGLQSYPLLQAERFVERDAKLAFLEAFQGRRMTDGTIIELPSGARARTDPVAGTIDFVSLDFIAEHVTWNGSSVELVAHHVVSFDRTRPDTNRVHDVYMKVSRDGPRLRYERFQIRGDTRTALPADGNPWLPILTAIATGGSEPWLRATDRPVVDSFE